MKLGPKEDSSPLKAFTPEKNCLVCPESKLALRPCSLEEARKLLSANGRLIRARSAEEIIDDDIRTVMLREDGLCAYPIVNGIPVLLGQEKLVPPDSPLVADRTSPKYQEAYDEMSFYDSTAARKIREMTRDRAVAKLFPGGMVRPEERSLFPDPLEKWIDAVYDGWAQIDAYRFLAPLRAKRVIQIGGKGLHAVKFLVAGARESLLLTPMLEEALFAQQFAAFFDVQDRLQCVVGVAEEAPFRDESFDGIYSGGCVHHMVTDMALPEMARILCASGRFAAVEPWKAPFYTFGTRLFGKREVEVHCRPLDSQRIKPFLLSFPAARVVHHGTLTRYPMLALNKLGIQLGLRLVKGVTALDDSLCSLIPHARSLGSSVALLAEKRTR